MTPQNNYIKQANALIKKVEWINYSCVYWAIGGRERAVSNLRQNLNKIIKLIDLLGQENINLKNDKIKDLNKKTQMELIYWKKRIKEYLQNNYIKQANALIKKVEWINYSCVYWAIGGRERAVSNLRQNLNKIIKLIDLLGQENINLKNDKIKDLNKKTQMELIYWKKRIKEYLH